MGGSSLEFPKAKGWGGIKIFLLPVVGYGYFLESPIFNLVSVGALKNNKIFVDPECQSRGEIRDQSNIFLQIMACNLKNISLFMPGKNLSTPALIYNLMAYNVQGLKKFCGKKLLCTLV